jgi:UDP:flavonoid glycosyltransferase YjiC (YdhE family)
MRFLFTTADLGGNVSPIMPVVDRLVRGGHRVRVMSDDSNRAEAEAAGARFIGWTRAPNKRRRAREADLPDWDVPVEEGLRMVAQFLGSTALAYAEDTIGEFRREPAELVVCFDMLLGPMMACEAIGQRLALLGTMISFFPLPGIPPLGSALPPARTEAARALEHQRRQEFEAIFDSALPGLNAARGALRLAPLAHLADQWDAAERHWLGTARAFDFPGAQLRPGMRYAGPLVGDPAWAAPWQSPWSSDDRRPLVLVAFSTSFQNHAAVLQRVIDAAAPLPVRLLVTLGGAIRPDEVVAAENTAVVGSAPHTRIMPEAALVVTHGGHGTVMAALMHRLPMLILPHGRDQGDNAVRVTERGAGLALAASAEVAEIRTALQRLLGEESFRDAARRLGDAVAAEARDSTLIDDIVALAAEAAPSRRAVPA